MSVARVRRDAESGAETLLDSKSEKKKLKKQKPNHQQPVHLTLVVRELPVVLVCPAL